MNLDEIINYQRPKESLYDILGCDQSSSVEQINREYKIKALQLHPDKNDDPKSLDDFRRIQFAKDILTEETSRRSYDSWLNSRINIPFEQWRTRKNHSMHWAAPRSGKLSLLDSSSSSSGQGSDFKFHNDHHRTSMASADPGWLEKFRKYEI